MAGMVCQSRNVHVVENGEEPEENRYTMDPTTNTSPTKTRGAMAARKRQMACPVDKDL